MNSALPFRAAVVVLVGSMVLATAVTALAADAPAGMDPAAIKSEARERFDRGLRLFETNDYAAALAEFKRAYDLIPNLVVMYNIGLVYAEMNRPVDAADALDLALADGGTHLSAEQRRNAQRVSDQQAKRIAQVIILTPRPATIEIDGVEVGRTPLAKPLRIPSGAHTIAVVATGYLPSRKEVMFAGQVTETLSLTLMPAETTAAHLTVAVSVPGADVLVNGKSVGLSPLPASVAVAPGATHVEVHRAGYRSATRTLSLDEGATGSVDVALEEDPGAPASLRGRLQLLPSEPDAEVWIDGVPTRVTPGQTLSVIAGPHQLRVQHKGFEPAERAIEVTAAQQTTVAITLTPTAETQDSDRASARTLRMIEWGVLGSGVLLAGAAVIYSAVTRNDISEAQAQLDAYLPREMVLTDLCYNGPNPPHGPGAYTAAGCGTTKASLQDDVNNAKLRRDIAYGSVGLGIVIAGVGTYLIATDHSAEKSHEPTSSQLSFWATGQGGGLMVLGRF